MLYLLRIWPVLLPLISAQLSANELVAPYVPTVEEDVELMLDIAALGPTDHLIDLGSGDGRIVIAAARRGATAHGVELDAGLVELAQRNAARAGVDERAAFLQGDIFTADIAHASVITLYLFPEANLRLRPKLLEELRPGTRVLSNSFDMGDWIPDARDFSARSSGGILLWIVPADAAGRWTLDVNGDVSGLALDISQHYQNIAIKLSAAQPQRRSGLTEWLIQSAALSGPRISFRAENAGRIFAFSGYVERDHMQGIVQMDGVGDERVASWRAARLRTFESHPPATSN